MADEKTVEIVDDTEAFYDADQTAEMGRKIEGLEREKLQLESENKESNEKIKELTTEIEKLKRGEKDTKEKLREMELEIERNDEGKNVLESVANRAMELETEVSRLQQDLISAMAEVEEANNEVAELKRVLGEKGAKIDRLEKELESLKKAKAESEKWVRELERKIGVLEVKETEEKSKRIRVEEEMRERLDEKENELSLFKKKIEELESVITKNGVELVKKAKETLDVEAALRESANIPSRTQKDLNFFISQGMMTMMEGSSIPPLLIRNLISSIFIFADKSLLNLSQKSKLLQLIRCVLVTSFLFFLRLLPPLNPSDDDVPYRKGHSKKSSNIHEYEFQIPSSVAVTNTGGSGGSAGSAIGRALSQLLSLMNDIPVSSRKYQVVRSLAETLIEDNHKEGVEALRQVNRTVLSAAFSRTLGQLEAAAALEQQVRGGGDGSDLVGPVRPAEYRLSRVLRAVRSIGDVAWLGAARASGSRSSAEKLAAEVLWLAEKLAACGYGDEAVVRWASASNLAWLSVSVEPSLQASLVKVSALLFKHAKDMGMDAADDDESKEQQKQRKMQMLMSWLPLLCRASNGTDVPVLSIRERAELERVLEDIIEMLEKEEDQEKVLSLWLHHFTYCSSSDWPNLHASYARWCNASRKLLLHHHDI